MLKKTLLVAVVFGAAAATVQAGPYVTGSMGQSDADRFNSSKNFAYKMAIGLQANEYIAVEAQYVDLGKAKDKSFVSSNRSRATAETAGIGANLVGTLPLNEFKLFAKVGYHRLETKSKLAVAGDGSSSRKKHDWVPSMGIGAAYALSPTIEAIAEYERYRHTSDRKVRTNKHVANFKHDVDMASVGLRYKF